MDLSVEEIKHIITSLDFRIHKMEEDFHQVRYPDPDERIRFIKGYRKLSEKFKEVLESAFDDGKSNFSVPSTIDGLIEVTKVKAFSDTEQLNEFLTRKCVNKVVSITPWLRNHGYAEYLLTYTEIVENIDQ